MKFIGVLLSVGLICAASAKSPKANPEQLNTVNSHFVNFLQNERVNFPCGWPVSGVPPLEPHRIDEIVMNINTDPEFQNIDFRIRNADLTRIMHMCFTSFDFAMIGLVMRFEIHFDRLNIVGAHTTTANMISGGTTIPVTGQGNANLNINDMFVAGVGQMVPRGDGTLNMNRLETNTVVRGTATAALSGFGALDGTMSRVIGAAIPGLVNTSQDQVNQRVNEILLPAFNSFLNRYTLTELINIMAERVQSPEPRRCFGDTPRTCPNIF